MALLRKEVTDMGSSLKTLIAILAAGQGRDSPPKEENQNQNPQSSEVRGQDRSIRVSEHRVQIHEHQFPQYYPLEPIRVEKVPFRQQEPPIGHQGPAIHQQEPLNWLREHPIEKSNYRIRYGYFNPPTVETAAMAEHDLRIDNRPIDFQTKEFSCRAYGEPYHHPDTGDGYDDPRSELGSKPRYQQNYSNAYSGYGQFRGSRVDFSFDDGLNSLRTHDGSCSGLGNLNCGKSVAGCVGIDDQKFDSLENQTEGISSLGDDGWKVDNSSPLEKVESVLGFVDNEAEMQDKGELFDAEFSKQPVDGNGNMEEDLGNVDGNHTTLSNSSDLLHSDN